MKVLNSKELLKLINDTDQNRIKISDCEIVIEKSINIDLCIDSIEFNNCLIRGSRIDFYDFLRDDESKDEYCSLSFINCTIENDLVIKDCYLYAIEFNNVKIYSKTFFISSADIKRLTIVGSPKEHNNISSLVIDHIFEDTIIDIRLNDFREVLCISSSVFGDVTINGNNIDSINVQDCTFNEDFSFWKNKIISNSLVDNCSFNDINCDDSNFGTEIHFKRIKFLGNCSFENLKNLKTRFKFTKCNFEKYAYFDKSDVYEIIFDTAFFKEIVSFQNMHCDKIKLNRTHFDKVAFFNDLRIDNPDKCDLKTVRIIKNQLLKIENRIDYLKYTAIEQNNLLQNSNLSSNDKILLRLNKESNDFGNNWIRGVKFTLVKGIQFFLLLLLVNSFIVSKYPLSLWYEGNIASFPQVLTEFLKFVFSLGFDNKEIQSNGFLYLIFIVAKIYIGYGIYQTISAFRKYGKS